MKALVSLGRLSGGTNGCLLGLGAGFWPEILLLHWWVDTVNDPSSWRRLRLCNTVEAS